MKNHESEVLSKAGFGNRMGFGKKTALVCVDFSVGFTNPAVSPLAADYTNEMAGTNRVIEIMRNKGFPIAFTTIAYDKNLADSGVWKLKFVSAPYLADEELIKINRMLDYQAQKDTLIAKKGASSFFGTNLNAILSSQSVDTVIITGVTTSGCVRATAVDSCQHGFKTIVIRECVGDRVVGPHEANLFDIDSKYGDVMSLDDVLKQLGKY